MSIDDTTHQGRLHASNLLVLFGETVTDVARRHHWTPEKLEEDPTLLNDLFETVGDNLFVPEGVTTEVHSDNRRGSTVLHERLPILELSGVQVSV